MNWDIPIIQLYSPPTWHDPQVIVCNAAGRKLLAELLAGEGNQIQPMVSDGECYTLVVVETETPEDLPVPYTAEMASGASTRTEWERWEAVVNPIMLAAEVAAGWRPALAAKGTKP